MKKLYSFFIFSFGFGLTSLAQCAPGEVDVTVDVITDSWGYECYWDLTPAGNGCGNGTLYTFGNILEVNCASGGTQVAMSGGYADNSTTTESVGCLTIGNCFDINYVDDYGDGGATFIVKFNGVVMYTFVTDQTTVSATFSFCASTPPAFDAALTALAPYSIVPRSQGGVMIAPANIQSAGTNTITGTKIDVTVLQGSTNVYTASSATQSLPSGANSLFSVNPFSPVSSGTYTVNYTATINETEEVPSNNTATYNIDISDTVYALDDNASVGLLGLGSGELGYLGNLFEIVYPIDATSISAYLGNGGGNFVDSVFKLHIFSTNPLGIPSSLIATATGVLESTTEKWYTVKFSSPVSLVPGKYMIALEEENYQQELGASISFHPQTSFVYSLTQIPWSPVEDFDFPISFLMRLNLAPSGLGLFENSQADLGLFPNPASNKLTISGTSFGHDYSVYNQMGQVVQSGTTREGMTDLNIEDLTPGIYTIKTMSADKIGVAKFVKQ
ncbi:MAG: T9SS type A sorting domain-containing protein [Crocinitomicaceae bacterium]